MQNCFVFMLDNDKDFLKLYSTILQNKGCKIFATDNLFIFMEYAKTVKPYWIFIDENYASFPAEIIINIIQSRIHNNEQTTKSYKKIFWLTYKLYIQTSNFGKNNQNCRNVLHCIIN